MELIIVMALIGILAFVVVPRFSARDGVNARVAARQLATDLRYAQARAIATRVRYGVAFEVTSGSWTVYRQTPATPADDFLRPGTPMQRHPEGVTITTAEFDGGDRVEFDSMGTPRSAGGELFAAGTVILAAGAVSDTVRVTPITGSVVF